MSDNQIRCFLHEYNRCKRLIEAAIADLNDDDFYTKQAEFSNSIAILIKHLSGNFISRWSEFLSTDGNKANRQRDDEFIIHENDTRTVLMARWAQAWEVLFQTFDSLQDSDLSKVVTIRGEEHTVLQAILRNLSHMSLHCGQILYLARLFAPESDWLTIAPGESKQFSQRYFS